MHFLAFVLSVAADETGHSSSGKHNCAHIPFPPLQLLQKSVSFFLEPGSSSKPTRWQRTECQQNKTSSFIFLSRNDPESQTQRKQTQKLFSVKLKTTCANGWGGSMDPNSSTNINFLNAGVIGDTHLPEDPTPDFMWKNNKTCTFIQMNSHSIHFILSDVHRQLLWCSPPLQCFCSVSFLCQCLPSLHLRLLQPFLQCLKEANFNTHTGRRTKPREDRVWSSSKGPLCMYARAAARSEKRAPACTHANRYDALQHPEQFLQQRQGHLLPSDFHYMYIRLCPCSPVWSVLELSEYRVLMNTACRLTEWIHSLLCHRDESSSGSVSGVNLALEEFVPLGEFPYSWETPFYNLVSSLFSINSFTSWCFPLGVSEQTLKTHRGQRSYWTVWDHSRKLDLVKGSVSHPNPSDHDASPRLFWWETRWTL